MKLAIFYTRARDKGKFWGTDEMWNFFKILLGMNVCYLAFLSNWYDQAFYVWIVAAAISTSWLYYWEITREWQLFQPNSRHRVTYSSNPSF
jgi:hypothetical protein